jgi:hypothetical protein
MTIYFISRYGGLSHRTVSKYNYSFMNQQSKKGCSLFKTYIIMKKTYTSRCKPFSASLQELHDNFNHYPYVCREDLAKKLGTDKES